MSLCASCGAQLAGVASLCSHHPLAHGDDWAVVNRVMCDFLHRKQAPPDVPSNEPNDQGRVPVAKAA